MLRWWNVRRKRDIGKTSSRHSTGGRREVDVRRRLLHLRWRNGRVEGARWSLMQHHSALTGWNHVHASEIVDTRSRLADVEHRCRGGDLADRCVELLRQTSERLVALSLHVLLTVCLWSGAAVLVATVSVLHVCLQVARRQVRASTSRHTVLRPAVRADEHRAESCLFNSLNGITTPATHETYNAIELN